MNYDQEGNEIESTQLEPIIEELDLEEQMSSSSDRDIAAMQMEMEQKIMEAKILEDKLSRMKQLRELQQGEDSDTSSTWGPRGRTEWGIQLCAY